MIYEGWGIWSGVGNIRYLVIPIPNTTYINGGMGYETCGMWYKVSGMWYGILLFALI